MYSDQLSEEKNTTTSKTNIGGPNQDMWTAWQSDPS